MTLSFTHRSRSAAAPFAPQGRVVNRMFFDSLFLKVGFLPDLFDAYLRATDIDLFFCVGQPVGAWLDLTLVLNFVELRTDWLASYLASINLEKEEKDRFSENTLYSSACHEGKCLQPFLRSLDHINLDFLISLRKHLDLRLSTFECDQIQQGRTWL